MFLSQFPLKGLFRHNGPLKDACADEAHTLMHMCSQTSRLEQQEVPLSSRMAVVFVLCGVLSDVMHYNTTLNKQEVTCLVENNSCETLRQILFFNL